MAFANPPLGDSAYLGVIKDSNTALFEILE